MAGLKTQVTVMLHDDDLSYLDRVAEERRVSRADVLREAVARMRKQDEAAYEKADTPLLTSATAAA